MIIKGPCCVYIYLFSLCLIAQKYYYRKYTVVAYSDHVPRFLTTTGIDPFKTGLDDVFICILKYSRTAPDLSGL